VKTDRFSATRAAAASLAGLLLAASGLAAGQQFHVGSLTSTPTVSSQAPESRSKELAKALAPQAGEVQQRFAANRSALRSVRDAHGEPAYLRQEVAALIDGAEKDLDQAIARIGEPGLDALRAWSADELRPIQDEAAAPADHAAGRLPGLFAPRAVAVVASLGRLPRPAPPQPATITAERGDRLLDRVGEVISRIFFLAETDDLEVELWVGSTAPHSRFSFWPLGQLKGATPAPLIIRTDGRRDHVLRGLYAYRAAWTIVDSRPVAGRRGAVTELVEYPDSAGGSANRSERLDLVNGTGFFCCRFNEQYCHHVAAEKECRP
jgi:hypothetical protein